MKRKEIDPPSTPTLQSSLSTNSPPQESNSDSQLYKKHTSMSFSLASLLATKPAIKYIYSYNNLYTLPYSHYYLTSIKSRWLNRTIADIFISEFMAYQKEYYIKSIKNGKIRTVEKIVEIDYIVKPNDKIVHLLHKHEPPINGNSINIVYETPELIVIDKPPSMPIHPCGKYRYNTILMILEHIVGKKFYSVHRLDRLTSGLVLIARSQEAAKKLNLLMTHGRFVKQYVARVIGNFPDKLTVNQPLGLIDKLKGIQGVTLDGKQSITLFKKLSFNGHTSVVLCQPLTGRSHQIRVHLQYSGYPIANDPNYGGCLYKANSNYVPFELNETLPVNRVQATNISILKDLEEEKEIIYTDEYIAQCDIKEVDSNLFKLKNPSEPTLQPKIINEFNNRVEAPYKIEFYSEPKPETEENNITKEVWKPEYDSECDECNMNYWDNKDLHTTYIWLHAWRYTTDNINFEVPLPSWANDNFNCREKCDIELRHCKDGDIDD